MDSPGSAIFAITAGVIFNIKTIEWIAITFAIGFVFTAELLNSSIERLADFASQSENEFIKKIKDLAEPEY